MLNHHLAAIRNGFAGRQEPLPHPKRDAGGLGAAMRASPARNPASRAGKEYAS